MVLMVAVASALQDQKGYLLMWPCEQTTGVPHWPLSHQMDKQLLGSLCWPSHMHLHSVCSAGRQGRIRSRPDSCVGRLTEQLMRVYFPSWVLSVNSNAISRFV